MKARRNFHWIGVLFITLTILAAYAVISVAETYADTTTTSVQVTSSTLNVRSGPGSEYNVVGKLTLNQKVTVTGSVMKGDQKWYRFLYNAKTAYINAAYTKKLSVTTTYSPLRTGQALYLLNVRSKPSTTAAKVGTIAKGKVITLRALYIRATVTSYRKWYRITFNGETAYVVASYLKMLPTVHTYDPIKTAIATRDTVYRSGPGGSYDAVGSIKTNTQFVTTAKVTTYTSSTHNVWYKTTYNGKTAYVYAGFCKLLPDEDPAAFENYLTSQGFPDSYKTALRSLHTIHPKWVFVAQKTGINWVEALAKEQKVGISLLSSSQPDSWKSFESGAYDFTNNKYVGFDGSWNAADAKVVAYYLDPRNFLTESSVYQFLNHKFDANSQTTSMIRAIAAGTFMNTESYATIIYNSGKASGVNPNVITSIIRQEQGPEGDSGSISGTVSGYEGIYNFFNVQAYTTNSMTAVQRGLWWAKGAGVGATTYGRPWTTKTKSITGGALYYKENYIDKHQDTFYLKKFNVLNGIDSVGVHQYMTHILAAAAEGNSLSKAYANYHDYPLIFSIPIYNGMPTAPVAKPGTTGNNDNVFNSLRVINASTESQYELIRSSGTAGFARYTSGYTTTVPSSVTKIIVNGIAHNNLSYVNASYVTLGGIDASLPSSYANKGARTQTTTVTADLLYVQSDAGIIFPKIGSYKKGTTVTVTGTKTDLNGIPWYKVSYGGNTGYISSTGTNKLKTTLYYSDWMAGTTKESLNVRVTPSGTSTCLGAFASGEKIQIYGYVLIPNPDTGTVKKWYMTSYKGATVTGGDVISLAAGTNVINVTVKSTSGQKRTYTITVKRP